MYKGGFAGALLTDLSKAFDCLSHELLIAKVSAYGFSYHALKLIYSKSISKVTAGQDKLVF